MFGLKLFVRVQTFRRGPQVPPHNFCHPAQVSDTPKVISNGSIDFNDPKELHDLQVFDDPKGFSIGSMDFDNPKVYGDTSL